MPPLAILSPHEKAERREKKERIKSMMNTIIKNETAQEKEYRIFKAYKKILSKDRKTRFNVVEHVCRFSQIDPYKMAAKLKGKRTRELVAEQMNMSTGQVARFEKIEKHGSEELISKLMKNELNLPEAENLTKLDKEEQKEILQQSNLKNLKEEVQQRLKEKEKRVEIKPMKIKGELENILVNLEETVYIREKEYEKLKRILVDFKKIMENGEI